MCRRIQVPIEWEKLCHPLILNFLPFVPAKDLSRVKSGFESVPPQFYFEIAGLASAVKWRKIQNIDEEERF